MPLIDHWVIVDTGSTDGTQDMIRAAMSDVPGALYERPWRDFAHNRTEALHLARPHADYTFIIDADDELLLTPDFKIPTLSADSYTVDIADGGVTYQRTQCVRNSLPWRYAGVLHEFLTCDSAQTVGHLPIVMRRNHDGRRRRDPATYRRDAALLERALASETDPFLAVRYTFYLAQSYRDAGNSEVALACYLRRATQGYWDQEVFYSLYQAGRLMEELGCDADEIIKTYQRASDACPTRAEAAHAASRLCRILGRNAQGYAIAKPFIDAPAPVGGLFVEIWVYRTGLLDEFAVNAYWAGHYRECQEACFKLLAQDAVPDRDRIIANARFAMERLADGSGKAVSDINLWPAGTETPGVPLGLPAIAPSRGESGLVSIITPTRNRARHLQRAMTYVRSQTYKNVEWLILDDSADAPDAISDFGGDRISYDYCAEKLSIGDKRNRLVEKAKGEIIIQFDDDDYYAPDYVATMVSALSAREADLVNLRGWYLYDLRAHFFGYWDLMQKEGLHYRCSQDGVTMTILTPKTNDDFKHNHLGYGFGYAFRRSVWNAVKFPAIDWNEDGEFCLQAKERFKVDGVHDTTGLCVHFLHPGSTSICFPQHHLPRFLFRKMFPTLNWAA